MPVTDGVVAHGEKIEAGGDPVDKPGFQAAEHAVAGKHIGGGKIEIAGGGIEAADGQILPGFRLNGFPQIFLRGAEGAEEPEGGEPVQAAAEGGMGCGDRAPGEAGEGPVIPGGGEAGVIRRLRPGGMPILPPLRSDWR